MVALRVHNDNYYIPDSIVAYCDHCHTIICSSLHGLLDAVNISYDITLKTGVTSYIEKNIVLIRLRNCAFTTLKGTIGKHDLTLNKICSPPLSQLKSDDPEVR